MMSRRLRVFSAVLLAILIALYGVKPAFAKPAPKNGVQREYYTNGKLRLEIKHKNGEMIRRRVFYRNGKVMLDYRYKNEAPYYRKLFYENGQVKSFWTKKSGIERYYSKTGQLKATFKRE